MNDALPPAGKPPKAEMTRQKILDVSLALFRRRGYEKATMRAIAKSAGLAPGAAYYHFKTKEHIIFEFYEKSFDDHLPGVDAILAGEKSLEKRIAGVVAAHLEVARPFYDISKALFQTAIVPDHPLSPFSEESRTLREKNIAIFRRVVEDSDGRIPGHLKESLPEILWLFKMGIILYWIYDKSPDQKKTFELIDRGAALSAKLLTLSNLPVLRGFSKQLLKIFLQYKPY